MSNEEEYNLESDDNKPRLLADKVDSDSDYDYNDLNRDDDDDDDEEYLNQSKTSLPKLWREVLLFDEDEDDDGEEDEECGFIGEEGVGLPGEEYKERIWALPDILVTVHKPGIDSSIGVAREVFPDGSLKIALESSGNGKVIVAVQNEIKIVAPSKSDKIIIMGGAQRGATGKLIDTDGTDAKVKFDDTLEVLDINILAKLAQV